MKAKDWIIEKLKENDYDSYSLITQDMYDLFITRTYSKSNYDSYYKQVRRYYNEYMKETGQEVKEDNILLDSKLKEDDRIELLEKYSYIGETTLLDILEYEIQERRTTLKYTDLVQIATENKFPVKLFTLKIKNLEKVLQDLYKVNLFHVQNDKKVLALQKELQVTKKELKYYKDNDYYNDKVLNILDSIVVQYKPSRFNHGEVKYPKLGYEAVALLSDWHYDEIVNRAEMHNLNEYSISIAKKRIDQLFKVITENSLYLKVDVINLLFLGDMISGNLHDLAENNERGIIKATIELANYISQHIRNLSKYFKKIKGIGLVGNHSRLKVKPYFKHKQVLNFEYILYEFIKRETKDIMDFILPESFFLIHEINGVNFLSTHGDMVRGGNGLNSVPGNLSRDISLLAGTLGQANMYFDYVNMGHFHSANETKSFNGAEIIMNGSLIGANEFSLGALKKGESPSQTFYIVKKDVGVRFLDRISVK